MRLNRFLGNFDLSRNELLISDSAILHQIKNVLRLKIGDQIVLGDATLNSAAARIEKIGKNEIGVRILGVSKNQNEPSCEIVLYCSVLKHDHLELAAQKAVEVGVSEIAPIVCERTVKTSVNQARLKKIMKEAAEQSGRGIIPILRPVEKFEEALERAKNGGVNFLFDASGLSLTRLSLVRDRANVFIGPEGGWSEKELALAQKNNFKIISLGKLTLRAETAAIVAGYEICRFLAVDNFN